MKGDLPVVQNVSLAQPSLDLEQLQSDPRPKLHELQSARLRFRITFMPGLD
jgi:hypothetical protein